MNETCEQHSFEIAVDRCVACNRPFCPDCLVYPHGQEHAALCVPCAIEFAGVRAKAGRTRRKGPSANMSGRPGDPSATITAKAGAAAGVVTMKVVVAVVGGVTAGTVLRALLL
jgi:hypothetical protein